MKVHASISQISSRKKRGRVRRRQKYGGKGERSRRQSLTNTVVEVSSENVSLSNGCAPPRDDHYIGGEDEMDVRQQCKEGGRHEEAEADAEEKGELDDVPSPFPSSEEDEEVMSPVRAKRSVVQPSSAESIAASSRAKRVAALAKHCTSARKTFAEMATERVRWTLESQAHGPATVPSSLNNTQTRLPPAVADRSQAREFTEILEQVLTVAEDDFVVSDFRSERTKAALQEMCRKEAALEAAEK